MAVRTEQIVSCDGCGVRVEKRGDLRRFDLEERRMSGAFVECIRTDLCTGCEERLHVALAGIFPPDELIKIEGLVRP